MIVFLSELLGEMGMYGCGMLKDALIGDLLDKNGGKVRNFIYEIVVFVRFDRCFLAGRIFYFVRVFHLDVWGEIIIRFV